MPHLEFILYPFERLTNPEIKNQLNKASRSYRDVTYKEDKYKVS